MELRGRRRRDGALIAAAATRIGRARARSEQRADANRVCKGVDAISIPADRAGYISAGCLMRVAIRTRAATPAAPLACAVIACLLFIVIICYNNCYNDK